MRASIRRSASTSASAQSRSVVLTQITSVTHRDVEVVRDASALGGSVSFSPFGAPEAGYTLDFPLVDATTAAGVTQEIRLAGAGERVDWVFGSFYGSFYGSSRRQYGQSAYAEDFAAINGALAGMQKVG